MSNLSQLMSKVRGQQAKTASLTNQAFSSMTQGLVAAQKEKEAKEAAALKETPAQKTIRDLITKQAQEAAESGDTQLLQDLEPQITQYYGTEGASYFKSMGEKHYNPQQKAAKDFNKMLTSVLYPGQQPTTAPQAEDKIGSPVASYTTQEPSKPLNQKQVLYEKINGLMTDDFKSRQLVKLLTGSDPGPHALTVRDWMHDFALNRKDAPNKAVAQAIEETAIKYDGFVPSEVTRFRDIDLDDKKALAQIEINQKIYDPTYRKLAQQRFPGVEQDKAVHASVLNDLIRDGKPLPESYQKLSEIISGHADIVAEQDNKELKDAEFAKAMGVEKAAKETFQPQLERKIAEETQIQEAKLLKRAGLRPVEKYLNQKYLSDKEIKDFSTASTYLKSSDRLSKQLLDSMKNPDGSLDPSKLPVGVGKGFFISLGTAMGIAPNKLQVQIKSQLAEMVRSLYQVTGANTTRVEMQKVIAPVVASVNEDSEVFVAKFSEFQRKYRDFLQDHVKNLKESNRDLGEMGPRIVEEAENMTILEDEIQAAKNFVPQTVVKLLQKNPGQSVVGGGYIWLKTKNGIKKAKLP